MGLIAHQLEEAGISTTSISTAKDITEAVRMPRSVFLDFPQGYTTGKVGDKDLAEDIVRAALDLLDAANTETLVSLPHSWEDDDTWKDSVFQVPEETGSTPDNRLERSNAPQYQSAKDRDEAAETHKGEICVICAGIDY